MALSTPTTNNDDSDRYHYELGYAMATNQAIASLYTAHREHLQRYHSQREARQIAPRPDGAGARADAARPTDAPPAGGARQDQTPQRQQQRPPPVQLPPRRPEQGQERHGRLVVADREDGPASAAEQPQPREEAEGEAGPLFPMVAYRGRRYVYSHTANGVAYFRGV